MLVANPRTGSWRRGWLSNKAGYFDHVGNAKRDDKAYGTYHIYNQTNIYTMLRGIVNLECGELVMIELATRRTENGVVLVYRAKQPVLA